jgi:hypothetical protein
MRERLFQFFQLFRGTVDFYAREISYFEHFREERANAFEMGENAVGAFVPFATENFVAVNSESVEKILFFSRRFLWQLTTH